MKNKPRRRRIPAARLNPQPRTRKPAAALRYFARFADALALWETAETSENLARMNNIVNDALRASNLDTARVLRLFQLAGEYRAAITEQARGMSLTNAPAATFTVPDLPQLNPDTIRFWDDIRAIQAKLSAPSTARPAPAPIQLGTVDNGNGTFTVRAFTTAALPQSAAGFVPSVSFEPAEIDKMAAGLFALLNNPENPDAPAHIKAGRKLLAYIIELERTPE